jgi:hypothetical protein
MEKQLPSQVENDGSNPILPLHISAKEIVFSLCPLKEVREFVETHHYSHNINGVKIKYCFKVEYNGMLVGAVLFGAMSTTAWKKFAPLEKNVLELRRLVLLDNVGKNSESKAIGYCLRYINKHNKDVKVIVSYADPLHGHSGTIYKASNFQYIGVSGKDSGFRDSETNKVYHSRALRTKYKGEYKPFVKKLREKLEKGLLIPYSIPPKHCYVYKFKS